ncbi:metaxin-1 isoform X1 [Larus michahellis]|uniref:metaxin-1 isoform X1 n=1 Tax=Larus michahellis TaxID=119627 RepID=UPI003D9BF531
MSSSRELLPLRPGLEAVFTPVFPPRLHNNGAPPSPAPGPSPAPAARCAPAAAGNAGRGEPYGGSFPSLRCQRAPAPGLFWVFFFHENVRGRAVRCGAVTYARFTGAPLKVHRVTSPWRSPSGRLPALKTRDEGTISKTQQIITHLRKQKYNADYDLSATQGADTLAFVSLLEEKLLPVLIHTFWVDAKNYVEHTRKWYAETIPFPLNFFLPNCMHKQHLERLQLMWGDGYMEDEEKLEKELYRDARECLTLLSQRLGSQKFFFGDSPASLDAFVFSRLAPLLKAKLPNGKLQQHLKSLQNLCNYCTSILSLYFPWDGGEPPASAPRAAGADGGEAEEDPHKRRNQLLSVLVGLVAMLGYAFLSGIVSIQRGGAGPTGRQPLALAEEEEEEEE